MSNMQSCPGGGRFQVCHLRNRFVGCCSTSACTDGCPHDDLRPASFNPHIRSQNQDCRQGGLWYNCLFTNSPGFMGCCKSNPCSDGCPPGNLTESFLAFNSSDDFDFGFLSAIGASIPSTTSSSISSFASSPTSINTADTPAGANTVASAAQGFHTSISLSGSATTVNAAGQSVIHAVTSPPKSNTAAIAGGVVGGIVGLALLLALLTIHRRWRTTRPLQDVGEGRSPTWGSGNARSLQSGEAELEEMKQGPSPTSSTLLPPSPLPSPLPPPPAYTPYRSHGNELDRSSNLSQPSASSPYPSHDLVSPESPPSPPPLNTRLSQHSTDQHSDERSVSPISSHYQHQPFDETGGPESSMYSEFSSSELLHTHSVRP
ncbi:hypothetical protein HO173_011873 [Letharia columbiana]|uniref:Uncharacterized protein n=1 Tax=Letharia columbiana TaxID=112416 RepID=A0A8H6CRJ0_9LECA|nr:uncharacterized protein HO173_011873 [Letharia columbiana]KAF6228570.1 hypothetical protein HO173_011873 [Letharia columbiana]